MKADYQKEMESAESTLTEEKEKRQKVEKVVKMAENADKEVEKATKEVEKAAIELKEKLATIETQAQKAASQALVEFQRSTRSLPISVQMYTSSSLRNARSRSTISHPS